MTDQVIFPDTFTSQSWHIKVEVWYWTGQDRNNETVVEPNTVLDIAAEKLGDLKLKDWCVGYEVSEEGYRHTHVTIEAYAKVMKSTVMKWFPKQHVDPCLTKQGKDNAWNYDLKDGLYRVKPKKPGFRSDLLRIQQRLDAGEHPMEIAKDNFPIWTQYGRRFQEYVSQKRTYEQMQETNFEDCDRTKFTQSLWTGLDKKPLVVIGPPGTGKTYWAQAHFKHPLIVSHIEDLRDMYDPNYHDGVVFDDCDFSHMSRQEQIQLLDIKLARTIKMRHHNWTRPKGLKMIFTGNEESGAMFHLDGAITRRVSYMRDVPCFWEDHELNEPEFKA